MKNISAVLICFGPIVYTTNAQTINDVSYFNYSLLPQTSFATKNGSTNMDKFEINLSTPPIQIGKRVKLINSFYYQTTQLTYDSYFGDREIFPSTLHDIRYNATLFVKIHKNLEILSVSRVLLRSDLKQSLASRDFFPSSIVAFAYSVKGNPNFKVGLGIAPIDNDFDRNAVYPLMLLLYRSKKVNIEVLYPKANFIYKQTPNFEYGIFSMVDGAISHVSAFNINNERTEYFRTFQWVVAPMVSHRIYKNLFAHLKIGYAPIRNIELLNKDFEAIKQDYSLKSSLYLRLGMSLRIEN
jgi:hypothetical protein